MRSINTGSADYGTILEHIFQVHQTAVVHMLRIVIAVMKLDQPFFMRLHDIRRKQKSSCKILTDLTSHVITLNAVDRRILVGVFLFYFLIISFNKGQDLLIRCIRLTAISLLYR